MTTAKLDTAHPAAHLAAAVMSSARLGPSRPPPLAEDSAPTLRAVASIFAAVNGGATFVLAGPDPLGAPGYGGTLESATGARHADSYGAHLSTVLVELADKWGKL